MTATKEINLDAEDIALSIAEFLSAKDCLALHTTSRRWNVALSKHEKSLFDKHLRHDFPEGEVLSYVANKKNLSRKKLYRAFAGRWSLPKQGDETLRAAGSTSDRNTKIITTWTRSLTLSDADYRGEVKILVNDDVENVILIASVGGLGGSFSALMQWNSDFDDSNFDFDQSKFDQLIIDKSWSEESGIVPFLPDAGYMGEDCCELTLSLYAIDIRYYQVAALMENTTMDESYYEDERPQLNVLYGSKLPSLFGIPPKTSPYHNEVHERDFDQVIEGCLDQVYPRLEYMTIAGRLRINVNENQWLRDYVVVNEDENVEWDEHYEETHELDHPWKGVNFCFTGEGDRGYECSVDQPYKICSFLSTLMKERCMQIENRPRLDIAMICEQPEWVQMDNIIDTITSFASHNDQASKIRLVCRNFRLSALRQIQAKVYQNELIGFMKRDDPYYGESLFRATVRHGWSDDFESKEDAIEYALWLASCRCRNGSCKGKKSCEWLGEHISFQRSHWRSGPRETQSIAVETVRQRLAEKGSVCLDGNFAEEVCFDQSNSVSCFYGDEETTLIELFREISSTIACETDPNWCYPKLHDDLKRDYGVSNGHMYCEGFVRSILLPFATAMNKGHILDASEGPREKKVRISPSITNAIIIEAKSNILIEDECVSRKVGIYRFISADNEPIEVHFDSSCMEGIYF